MNNKFMEEAFRLAISAQKNDEVPVGAVIVENNKIISRSNNKRKSDYKVISHAEINCILKANEKKKDWRLDNCEMYVTLRPCKMCQSIINASRISKVYYLIDKPADCFDSNKSEYIKIADFNIMKKKYLDIFQTFFKKKR